uniref:NADH dehydrogenase subunit 4L n=1 Tax=Crenidorsum turpiniae TaxID=2774091 RepID=A0A7L7S5W1_9HEMI|nr:NADH dehydrogenase subunit 4L [Crenidorsum turpiniae]QNV48538.1 NADH dehydrogenase subunit 4L [Crenidorsum turpiniae]
MTLYSFIPTQVMMLMKLTSLMYVMNKNHTLNNLIILEFISISTSSIALKAIGWMSMEIFIMLFILIILITESILGLSLLINMIRTHGNDYMKTSAITTF